MYICACVFCLKTPQLNKDEGAAAKMDALKQKLTDAENDSEALRMENKNLKRQNDVLEGALMVLNPSIAHCHNI